MTLFRMLEESELVRMLQSQVTRSTYEEDPRNTDGTLQLTMNRRRLVNESTPPE